MFAFKIIIDSFQIIKFSTFEMKGEQLFKKTKTDKNVILLSPRLSYCLLNKEDFRIYLEADSWLPIPFIINSFWNWNLSLYIIQVSISTTVCNVQIVG